MLTNDECQFIVNALDAFTKQTGLEHAARSLNIIGKLQLLAANAQAEAAGEASAEASEKAPAEASEKAPAEAPAPAPAAKKPAKKAATKKVK